MSPHGALLSPSYHATHQLYTPFREKFANLDSGMPPGITYLFYGKNSWIYFASEYWKA